MPFVHTLVLRGVAFAGINPLPLYCVVIRVTGVFRGYR